MIDDDLEAEMMTAFDAFVDSSLASVSAAEAMVWLVLFRDMDHTRVARTDTADIAR